MNASAREPRKAPATPPATILQAQEVGRQRLAELIGRLLAKRWLKTQPTASHVDTVGTQAARTDNH